MQNSKGSGKPLYDLSQEIIKIQTIKKFVEGHNQARPKGTWYLKRCVQIRNHLN